MKKILFLLMIIPMALFSQEKSDSLKTWDVGGLFLLNFFQVSLTNWVAGGRSSTAGVG